MPGPSSVDAYLAALPAPQQAALGRVRDAVRRLAPDAVEAISYGMPGFKINDRGLLWFAGWKSHCSLYPLTDAFLAERAVELEGFERTKGSLHFTPERPLSDDLLEALVRSRLADLGANRR